MSGNDQQKSEAENSWVRFLIQQGPAWITAITGMILALGIGVGVGYASKTQRPSPTPTVTVTYTPSNNTEHPSPPSPGSQYTLLYSNKALNFYGGSGPAGSGACAQGAYIDTDNGSIDPNGEHGGTVDLYGSDCTNHIYTLQPGESGVNVSRKGKDSPQGCLNEIASNPVVNSDTTELGGSFCVQNTSTGSIAYVYVLNVDSAGYVTVRATAWKPTN